MIMKKYVLAVMVVLGMVSFEKQPDSRAVLYSSLDTAYAEEILRASPSLKDVKIVSDTEGAKSSGLINRLSAERNRPVADVFLSGDPMRSAYLERHEIGKIYEGRERAARFRMLIINTERALGERPSSTLDLALPEFAKLSCIANPQFGTTSMHVAVLLEQYGEERVKKFLVDFVKNGGTIVASNGEVKRRVSSGEYAYGLTDSDDVSVAISDGKPVEYKILDLETIGAVAIPVTAVVINGCPHPEKARMLADYLTSKETEKILATSLAAHFPIISSAEKPSSFPFSYSQVKVASSDYNKLSVLMESFQPWLDKWVAEYR